MVDLAFLLITFFMLTTSLSKPQSMSLGLPDKDPKDKTDDVKVDENRTMTVVLGENDKMFYYMGIINTPMVPKVIAYGKDGIRKELLKRKKEVLAYSTAKGRPDQGMIVIIKPGKKSTYKNVVDILDEMAISSIPTYTIVNDFLPEEQKLLDGK